MASKINDLIFKELMKRGYSLRGNTRVWNIADSKLWYLTPKQAQAYLDFASSKDYINNVFNLEIDLLKECMAEISEKIFNESAINIIDIGCGDGQKSVLPIESLHKKTKLRYCPIDISSYMVSEAIKRISKINKGEVVKFRWNISDFDNVENVASLLRDNDFRQNLFLFLGGTICNFEFHEAMYEIVEAMNSGVDYLLLGMPVANKDTRSVISTYKSSLTDNFFKLLMSQIGFTSDNLNYDVRFENSRAESYYTLNRDIKISFGGRTVDFYKGDQFLVGFSYRYTEKELRKFMDIYFEEYKFYFNKDKSWALILCKK